MTSELAILQPNERQSITQSQGVIRNLDKMLNLLPPDWPENASAAGIEGSDSIPLGRFTIRLRADHGAVLARSIGIKVKAIRRHRRLTQAELARRSGIARANIARLEAGAHSPAIPTLKRVARALGIGVSMLLEEPSYSRTPEDDRWLQASMSEWAESLRREDRRQ
jgi:transcriptional regulator with XRE-family HTH domain